MTGENKNKSRLKAKSGILALGLVFITVIGIGFFGLMGKAQAETITLCTGQNDPADCIPATTTATEVKKATTAGVIVPPAATAGVAGVKPDPNIEKGFSKAVSDTNCGFGVWFGSGTIPGCILQVAYYTIYMLGSFLLWLAALLFNFLISYTLDSKLLRSDFIASAWGIVRDLSNIFFILILLYIAIKIILDFGGSEAKKMIGKVVIIALLINFSMFFTQVVIDSSNILALIFYNKIEPKKKTGEPATDPSGKKDISGGLTKSFNPATKLDKTFFEKAGETINLEGLPKEKSVVSTGVLIGITVISGLIMMFAAYALFISSLSFLGRLIELFILIIFSPFAFVSSTIPLLKDAKYLGWDNWFKRLLEVAFMAPIFMFFLYFIFLLLDKNGTMFSSAVKGEDFWVVLLNLVIPALIILILLIKATKFAKEGSGAIGDAVIKTASVGLGLAGALAIGGAAKGLQAGGGAIGESILRNEKWAKEEEAKKEDQTGRFKGIKAGLKRFRGRSLRTIAGGTNADGTGGLVGSSFDLRKGAVSGGLKFAEKVTGLNFGGASKFLLKPDGGHRGDNERAEKKRIARANSLKVSRDEPLQQELNKEKEQHYKMNNEVVYDINKIETQTAATDKNRTTLRLNSEADKAKLDESKSSLDTRGEEKARATLEKTASTHKTAQVEADATNKAATEAEKTAKTDIEKSAAANARIIANTKQEIAEQADKEHSDALEAYNKIIDDPEYIRLKAVYDADKKTYTNSVNAYQQQTDKMKGLTVRRANIKNAKATVVDKDGNIDKNFYKAALADAETKLTKAEEPLEKAKMAEVEAKAILKTTIDALTESGMMTTDVLYIVAKEKAEATYDAVKDELKKITDDVDEKIGKKEVATAQLASAQFGEGQSINDFEDRVIPEAQKKIEDENRERLIANTEEIRTEYRSPTMRVFRALFTPAGDNKYSRREAARKIIEDISKKKV